MSDSEALEIALIENLQREDLNPLDEARGYRELIKRFKLTQEQTGARSWGATGAPVANALRLLNLPDEVKRGLEEGKITVGHARALLGLTDDRAHRQRLQDGCSTGGCRCRQVEAIVRQRLKPRAARKVEGQRSDPEDRRDRAAPDEAAGHAGQDHRARRRRQDRDRVLLERRSHAGS